MKRPENSATALACGLVGEVVLTFGEVRLRVFGTSMVPAILPGSLVSVDRANLSNISVGEIVLYSRDGRLFAHRVVARSAESEKPSLITRGDRLRYNDPPITSAEFLGRVTCLQDNKGRTRQDGLSASQPKLRERIVLGILKRSDLATSAYLRLSSLRNKLSAGSALCRA
jgi:signal peptidase I